MVFLIALIAMFTPRLVLFFMWLFDYSKYNIAFDTFLMPFLGFLFLPYTTIIWVFAYSPLTGVTGWGWVFIVLGFLIDLGAYSGSSRR